MATLASGGRITEEIVIQEIARLRGQWRGADDTDQVAALAAILGPDKLAELDLFDRAQLAAVLEICRKCSSLSAAGRQLFAASRQAKSSSNDADRLRKYLARFGLDWAGIRESNEAR